MEKQSVYVHSNDEVARFAQEYEPIIFQACKNATLRRCDWGAVETLVLEKYAQGRIEYDPTRGTKPTSYYYKIAWRCAKDELKKQRFVELDEKAEASIQDRHNPFAELAKNDMLMFVEEAFKRLAMECRDKQKLQILLRYVLKGEDRSQLATEYGVTEDFVSLVKNRWRPRLEKLVREVIQEDMDGKLKFSDTDLRFLQPYMR